ncbi:MAG TPA: aminoglycoside phosphotransferase family protein [Rhizomicrobium sp.]
MPEGTIYSQRLGAIGEAQFEAVAARFNLGRFLKAEPTISGLFGQNVFVTTSEGDFVLRGAPHWVKELNETEHRREDRWQFGKEKFFARQLHERTKTPVPWPMLHDEASDIFGWPYLIMPRMPGQCFDERSIRKALEPPDRHGVAAALGEMLAEMQTLTWPFAGDFGRTSIALEPYPGGAPVWTIDETHAMVNAADKNGSMTADDFAWIEALAEQARNAAGGRPNTYVHCDYKLNNLTVSKDTGAWRVSGLFDLHEARFADGALDVVRQACSYLDTDVALARVFVESYRAATPLDRTLRERLPLYIVNDRMKFWQYFTSPNTLAEWTKGKTFRGWAQRYMDGMLALL